MLATIRDSVAYAREIVDDVEFSAEDAIRTERGFLVECLTAAVESGATTLNMPDTVGYTTPEEIYDLFRFLGEQVDPAGYVIFSTHCHDDLGMAVANSLAAVRGGARQVECAVNGIGERAGNCALEDVVMALKTRSDTLRRYHQRRYDQDHDCQQDAVADHQHAAAAQQGHRRARTPSPTKPGFISTACCRTERRTRS